MVNLDNKQVAESNTKTPDQNEIEKLYAILAYIPGLCFIALFSKNSNSFAIKHGKQGLLLFLVEIFALLFLIDAISRLFWTIILFTCLIMALFGIVYALLGQEWKVPYIGNIFEKYDL